MKPFFTVIICLFLLLARPFFALGASQDLLIFYSNDVHGETAPCG